MAYESFGETTCVIQRMRAISERLVRFFRKQFGRHCVILVGFISFEMQDHCYKFRELCAFIFVVCDGY